MSVNNYNKREDEAFKRHKKRKNFKAKSRKFFDEMSASKETRKNNWGIDWGHKQTKEPRHFSNQ